MERPATSDGAKSMMTRRSPGPSALIASPYVLALVSAKCTSSEVSVARARPRSAANMNAPVSTGVTTTSDSGG